MGFSRLCITMISGKISHSMCFVHITDFIKVVDQLGYFMSLSPATHHIETSMQWVFEVNLHKLSWASWLIGWEEFISISARYLLAQFRHLWNMFDCKSANSSRSRGLKWNWYSEFGWKWPETKASLSARSVSLCNSIIMEKPNWQDYSSIVSSGTCGSNNKCLACAPSQRGQWNRRAIPWQVDLVQKGCSSLNDHSPSRTRNGEI